MPPRSTPLDFAYYVHTQVGHRCRGAKVNGRIVPLTYKLQNGEQVEILTAKHGRPSRDWLNPRLGFIRGARARAKVRQWYRRESHEENLAQGKEMVEADLRRLDLSPADLESVPERFNFNSVDDLYAAVGNGDLTVSQVVHAVERFKVKEVELTAEDLVTRTSKRRRAQESSEGDDVTIEGVGNLMTSMARCCQPVPGDSICGYITRGRGVELAIEAKDFIRDDAVWDGYVDVTLDVAGFGNDNTGNSLYEAGRARIPLNRDWQFIVLPIPASSRLVSEAGLFTFAEGAEETHPEGYSIWFDEIRFATLGTITNPRPTMASRTIETFIGATVTPEDTEVTFDVSASYDIDVRGGRSKVTLLLDIFNLPIKMNSRPMRIVVFLFFLPAIPLLAIAIAAGWGASAAFSYLRN